MALLLDLVYAALIYLVCYYVLPTVIFILTKDGRLLMPTMILAGLVAGIVIGYANLNSIINAFLFALLTMSAYYNIKAMNNETFIRQHEELTGHKPKFKLYSVSFYLYIITAFVVGTYLRNF